MRDLRVYRKSGAFTAITADAIVYRYTFSTCRRVYKFHDIKVNLYI